MLASALIAIVSLGRADPASAQIPVLYFDFESNTNRTVFENAVEAAINAGSGPIVRVGSTASVVGAPGAAFYEFGPGTTTGMAAQSDQWSSATSDPGSAAAEYFQFTASTQGFAGLQVVFDDSTSADGPGSVGLACSTDGVTFTSLAPQATLSGAYTTHFFTLPAALEGQPSVTLRIYGYADGRAGFASSGTLAIDNLQIWAAKITSSKTLLDYVKVFQGISGATLSAVFVYGGLTVTGSGTVVTLASLTALGGNATVDPGATLALNNKSLVFQGTTLTNNGSIVGSFSTLPLSSIRFAGAAAQTYTGSGNVGSPADPLAQLVVRKTGGTITIDPAATLYTNGIQIIQGSLLNTSRVVLGNPGSSPATIQYGSSAPVTPVGSIDGAPTFALGSGGLALTYLTESVPRTTGPEIPPSRNVHSVLINTTSGVALGGGGLSCDQLILNGGTFTIGSANTVTLNPGGVLSKGGSGNFAFGAAGGTLRFPGGGQISTSSGVLNVNNLTLSGGTVSIAGVPPVMNGTLLMDGGALSSAVTYATGSVLKYNVSQAVGNEWIPFPGAYHVTVTNGATLDISGDNSARNIQDGLTIDAGAALTMGARLGSLTVNGNLDLNGTLALSTYVNHYMQVNGNWTRTGTLVPNGSIVVLGGASQTLTGATAFDALTVTGQLALNSDVTVGSLFLNGGLITTGPNKVVINNATGFVNQASNGRVFGNLRKPVLTGSPSLTFELGDAASYVPVVVSLLNVTTGGTLTASMTPTAHPALSTSGLNPSRSINRYWTLTNNGVALGSYNATFSFTPADVGAANPASFVVRRYDGTAWSAPAGVVTGSTSTQATGLTSFSDFAVGELAASARTLTWRSTSSSAWELASNWYDEGAGTIASTPPSALDRVFINGSRGATAMPAVTVVGQTCASLDVGSGFTLTVDGNVSPELTVGDGASGNDDVVIETSGRINNVSTAPSGVPFTLKTPALDRFRIAAGGYYFHNTPRSFATPFPAASCAFDPASTVEFGPSFGAGIAGGSAVALAGRTYGNLTLTGAQFTGSTGDGSSLNINGTLTVAAAVTWTFGSTVNANVRNIVINPGATLSFDNSTTPLVITGNVTNNGTLVTSSIEPVTFDGNTLFSGATALTTFNNGFTVSSDLFAGNRVLAIAAGINVPVGRTATIIGTLQMESGGALTNPPTYANFAGPFGPEMRSLLVYHRASVGAEWGPGSTIGAGVPANVTVDIGAGTLDLPSGPSADRVVPIWLRITSGNISLHDGDLTAGQTVPPFGGAGIQLGDGVIHTGTHVVSQLSGQPGRNNGYVDGKLRLFPIVPTGGNSANLLFPVGSGSSYAPVNVLFGFIVGPPPLQTPGSLTVSTTGGDHPSLASSAIDPTRSINRYWSLTTTDGLVPNDYLATFFFPAGDIDPGVDPEQLTVRRFDGTWHVPSQGVLLDHSAVPASITALELTPLGDFAAGDLRPPSLTVPGPITANEGSTVSFTATAVDPDNPPNPVSFSLVVPPSPPDASIDGVTGVVTWVPPDNGSYVLRVRADNGHASVTGDVPVTVLNVPPTVVITGPPSGSIFQVGTAVTFTGSFSDPGTADTHTAQWSFDTIVQAGTVDEGAHTVSASYTFSTAGVYMVRLDVTDDDGGTGTATQVGGLDAMIVVYDPNGGFVTGGGWITSPPGAVVASPSLTGRADFGFVSKYVKNSKTPIGETEFAFKLANLSFQSSSYDWLVISGARGQYKGSGTVNGSGSFGFLLTCTDGQRQGGGDVDRLRMKIWDTGTGSVIYDNQLGAPDTAAATTALGAGAIIIQPNGGGGGSGGTKTAGMGGSAVDADAPTSFALRPPVPSPFLARTEVSFDLAEPSVVRLSVFDVQGREVARLVEGDRTPGHYREAWTGIQRDGRPAAAGVYLIRLEALSRASGQRSVAMERAIRVGR